SSRLITLCNGSNWLTSDRPHWFSSSSYAWKSANGNMPSTYGLGMSASTTPPSATMMTRPPGYAGTSTARTSPSAPTSSRSSVESSRIQHSYTRTVWPQSDISCEPDTTALSASATYGPPPAPFSSMPDPGMTRQPCSGHRRTTSDFGMSRTWMMKRQSSTSTA